MVERGGGRGLKGKCKFNPGSNARNSKDLFLQHMFCGFSFDILWNSRMLEMQKNWNHCGYEYGGRTEEGARLDREKFICYRLQVYDEDFMRSTCKQIVCDLSVSRDDCCFELLPQVFQIFSFIALINFLNLISGKMLHVWGESQMFRDFGSVHKLRSICCCRIILQYQNWLAL